MRKYFKCDFCGKSFLLHSFQKFKNDFLQNIHPSSREKDIISKSFNHVYFLLLQYRKTKENFLTYFNKDHSCKFCGKSFTLAGNLRMHHEGKDGGKSSFRSIYIFRCRFVIILRLFSGNVRT